MYRRRFLPLLGGLLGASAGCKPHGRPRKLRVSLIPRYMLGPLYLADELGYFREAGLQLDIQRMPESAQSMPLLAGGQLDVCFLGISPAFINAVLRGGRLRVVAAREVVTPNCGVPGRVYGSRAAFPNGFGDLHQLKGKRVAVTGRTTHIAFILDVLLESVGMSPNDVTVVYLRRNEALAALVGGKIDAMAFGELDAEPESASVKLVPGPSVEELLRGLQTTFVMFGRDLMDGDAETGIGFLWAYLRGVEQFRAGKTTRALDELALAEHVDPAKAGTICRDRISADGLVAPASVQRFVDWSVKKGFVEQSMDASRLIETRFVEEALRRLGQGRAKSR
jgi:NitT/TauT family transport system substrate-binding protein